MVEPGYEPGSAELKAGANQLCHTVIKTKAAISRCNSKTTLYGLPEMNLPLFFLYLSYWHQDSCVPSLKPGTHLDACFSLTLQDSSHTLPPLQVFLYLQVKYFLDCILLTYYVHIFLFHFTWASLEFREAFHTSLYLHHIANKCHIVRTLSE